MAKAKKRVLSLVLSLAMLLALLPATALAEGEMEVPGGDPESGITTEVPEEPKIPEIPETPEVLGAPEGSVAKVGDVYYTTLNEAVEMAEEGSTIELLTDCELTKGFNKTLTFTGTGKITIPTQLTSNGEGWMCFGLYDPTRVLTFDGPGVSVEWMSDGSSPWLMLSLSGTLNVQNGARLTFMFDSRTTNARNAIYMNKGATINVKNGSTFEILGTGTEGTAGQGIQLDQTAESYINVTGGSTFRIDGTNRGYVNSPIIYVENSAFSVCNCTSNASNGCGFTAVNSTITFDNNAGHGLSAGTVKLQNSSLSCQNNGLFGFTYSGGLTMDGTSSIKSVNNAANGSGAGMRSYGTSHVAAGARIELLGNHHNALENYGNFTFEEGVILRINGNDERTTNGGGIYNEGTMILPSDTEIMNNHAAKSGGGICNDGVMTIPAGVKLYNNHAGLFGDDIACNSTGGFTNASITFVPVGSGWVLDDCDHPITGWYQDTAERRWNAHGETPYMEEFTETTASGTLGLKAAHGPEVTIKFVNYDGTVISETKYPVGETIVVPADPSRPADLYYVYTFAGWDPAVEMVATRDAVYTATYTATYVPPYIPPVEPPIDIEDPDVPLADLPGLNTVDHYAYIAGYPDGLVHPGDNITRAEVATIFFRLFTDEYRETYWSTINSFSDVAVGDWFNNGVSTTANAGIVNGYPDGSFKPNNKITRAEFAAIAARFLSEEYVGPDLFTDISGHWAAEYINRAANAGWINGYPDGSFAPDAYITRAEAMTLVNNMLGRGPHRDHMLANMKVWADNPITAWYYEAVQEATNSHDYDWGGDQETGVYEIWTQILPERDWAALEKEWSNAYSSTGGQVMGN